MLKNSEAASCPRSAYELCSQEIGEALSRGAWVLISGVMEMPPCGPPGTVLD